jgi:hypothetical protein
MSFPSLDDPRHLSAMFLQILHSSLVLLFFGIFLGVLATLFSQLVHNDYYAFLALGPGGTPQTIFGYLKIKVLGLFAIRDPYKPAPIPSDLSRPGHLTSVPKRAGPRPDVRGIAPHRQMDQRDTGEIHQRFRSFITELAAKNPQGLRNGTSCLEKQGLGLFAVTPLNKTGNCPGEIFHLHASDGSCHLTLHPADASLVIRNGWGQTHPLGRGGWFRRWVPKGFMMVYAPRDEAELEVVKEIVVAACWWIGGVDVNGKMQADPPVERRTECSEVDGVRLL